MATLDEFKTSMNELKDQVRGMQSTEQSAVEFIRHLADQINNAAASASDLDGLRTDLQQMTAELQGTAQDWAAAIASQPTGSGGTGGTGGTSSTGGGSSGSGSGTSSSSGGTSSGD